MMSTSREVSCKLDETSFRLGVVIPLTRTPAYKGTCGIRLADESADASRKPRDLQVDCYRTAQQLAQIRQDNTNFTVPSAIPNTVRQDDLLSHMTYRG